MIDKKLLLHLFDYDRKLGALRWKNPPKHNSYLIGKIAGTKQNSNGVIYLRICVNKKRFFIHKLIYFIEHNEMPVLIDHIDGNGLNNKIENLRKSNERHNSQNKIVHRKGKLVGASWDKQRKKWYSSIQINGKTKNLGRHDSELKAHLKYISVLKDLE